MFKSNWLRCITCWLLFALCIPSPIKTSVAFAQHFWYQGAQPGVYWLKQAPTVYTYSAFCNVTCVYVQAKVDEGFLDMVEGLFRGLTNRGGGSRKLGSTSGGWGQALGPTRALNGADCSLPTKKQRVIRTQKWTEIRTQKWTQIRTQKWTQIRTQKWTEIRTQTWTEIWTQKWTEIWTQRWTQMGDEPAPENRGRGPNPPGASSKCVVYAVFLAHTDFGPNLGPVFGPHFGPRFGPSSGFGRGSGSGFIFGVLIWALFRIRTWGTLSGPDLGGLISTCQQADSGTEWRRSTRWTRTPGACKT